MARRRRSRSQRAVLRGLSTIQKGAIGLTTASIATSVGAQVITTSGGAAGTPGAIAAGKGATAMTDIAGFYPAMGTIVAGGGVLGMLGGLAPRPRKAKKRRR